ncbi:MAG: ParD-like antitoxin of type bacterial toxin-antitoxin system, partial [Hyphomicrobiales bacterium]|nr:ParD-like antitoxin of type bacterial toxin-antitoxin system [Hyphomicrobiales bacterium]
MAGFSSVKLSAEFVDEARSEARQLHRSVAGQIEYWARLGRAAEAVMPIAKVREALDSGSAYYELKAPAQHTLLYVLAAKAG